jgi:signal transduction histidine kinase/tetratricopeptide (TPR) repeat protein
MDFFVFNDELAQCESRLSDGASAVPVQTLVELAWNLRQRDTSRALRLADEAQAMLMHADLQEFDSTVLGARLTLVRAEARFLFADLVDAERMAREALDVFVRLANWAGATDVYWLLAWIAIDSGKLERSDQEFDLMIEHARRAQDPTRTALAEAVTGRMQVLRDPKAAEARWGASIGCEEPHHHPGVQMWRTDYLCMIYMCRGDSGRAASYGMTAYELALSTGQLRAAVICCTNIAENFGCLNDYLQSLDWAQRGLDLSRTVNWPRSLGGSLVHTAEIMRRLGNFDSAKEMFQEALSALAPLERARPYSIAQLYQGELALDRQDYEAAFDAFERLERKAQELDQSDFRIDSQRGQAHALAYLGKPQQALKAAQSALDAALDQGDISRQVAALMVLADIHTLHPQERSAHDSSTSAPLHYLQMALEATRSIEGYAVTGKLLESLSRAYAKDGDFARAYEAAMQAIAAHEKTHGQQTTNRAVAMQVVRQTEQARAESVHLRQLAASEANRAQLLQQTTATLERLSAVGQEITQHLNAEAIFEVLYAHVQALLHVTSFAIYIFEPTDDSLARVYCMEHGERIALAHVRVDNPKANTARCFRERVEICCDPSGPNHVPGTVHCRSGLFNPLLLEERAIGVITVQYQHPDAYKERDQLIFRTLSAYVAIALENAQNYRRLGQAQQELLEQQKLAALGSLVAGVAHELNTPIGNSILTASALQSRTLELAHLFEQNTMRRTDLAAYLQDSKEASELILRGLNTSARLVLSFKQVAVDRTAAHRRTFDLDEYLRQIVATMQNHLNAAGHTIEIIVTSKIVMDSYPGPLGQVIGNLINNAIAHGYNNRTGGKLRLLAESTGVDQVSIRFSDDGEGILEAHMPRIFDPFFTTKLGHGGSGLGLSISYNIVTSILGGQIAVRSQSGAGTTFTLTLPLVVES